MPEKVKAAIYVRKDTWDRFKAVTADLPGNVSASQLLDAYIQQSVEPLEQARDAVQRGDPAGFLRFFESMFAGQVIEQGKALDGLRRELAPQDRKEDNA
jgi:hypothetical protein